MDELLIVTCECPSCGGKFRPFEAMRVATTHHRRTCQRCGERWNIVTTPLGPIFGGQGRAYRCEYHFLGHTHDRRSHAAIEREFEACMARMEERR